MAVVSKTAAQVHPLSVSRSPLTYVAGEDMSAGDVVYEGADGKIYKASNDTAAHANVMGVVVSGRADGVVKAGDAVDVAFDGLVSGFSGTPGAIVYVGASAGTVEDAAPAAASGLYKFAVGVLHKQGLFLRLAAEPEQV